MAQLLTTVRFPSAADGPGEAAESLWEFPADGYFCQTAISILTQSVFFHIYLKPNLLRNVIHASGSYLYTLCII